MRDESIPLKRNAACCGWTQQWSIQEDQIVALTSEEKRIYYNEQGADSVHLNDEWQCRADPINCADCLHAGQLSTPLPPEPTGEL